MAILLGKQLLTQELRRPSAVCTNLIPHSFHVIDCHSHALGRQF